MSLHLNLSEWQKQWMCKEVVLECPMRGWVVGLRWLQTGFPVSPVFTKGYFDTCDEYEPGYFAEDKPRTLCYLVVPYPTRNPIKVVPDSVTPLSNS